MKTRSSSRREAPSRVRVRVPLVEPSKRTGRKRKNETKDGPPAPKRRIKTTRRNKEQETETDAEACNGRLCMLPDLVRDHIFSFMTIKEQLNQRLVCKEMKSWVDQRTKRLALHIPHSVVKNSGSRPFATFLYKSITHVITSVYLETERLSAYDDPSVFGFIRCHSANIVSLRLKRYFISSYSGKQRNFLDEMEVLRNLEIDEVWVPNNERFSIVTVTPAALRRITSLKLGTLVIYNEATMEVVRSGNNFPVDRMEYLLQVFWNHFGVCLRLTYFRPASTLQFLGNTGFEEVGHIFRFLLSRLAAGSLRTQSTSRASPFPIQLDLINWISFDNDLLTAVLQLSSNMRVEYVNVNTSAFRRGSQLNAAFRPRSRLNWLWSIRSFVSSSLVTHPYRCIQKLTFKASLIRSETIIGRYRGPEAFPNLKEFNIIIDIGCNPLDNSADFYRPQLLHGAIDPDGGTGNMVCLPRADAILAYFFPWGLKYKHVRTSNITFQDPVFNGQLRRPAEHLPTLLRVTDSFPNLQNLTMTGWDCKAATYRKVLKGFVNLQNLTLDRCSTFRPSCLIDGTGNSMISANFDFLKGLKKLALEGLDEMPSIANEDGLKPRMIAVLRKHQLTYFPLLSGNGDGIRREVWFRSTDRVGQQVPTYANIITRSMGGSNT